MCRLLNPFGWPVVALVGVGMLVLPLRQTAAEDKPIAKPEVVVKPRTDTTEQDLRKQLQIIPEAGLDKPDLDGLYPFLASFDRQERQKEKPPADFGPRVFETLAAQAKYPERSALPWIDSTTNELTKDEADDLRKLAMKIHLTLNRAKRTEQPDLTQLRKLFTGNEWTSSRAVPALTQILQIESTEVRLVLIEVLGAIQGEKASVALAKRAIFDLSPKVREKAVQTLAWRPPAEYTPTLISGFRYPWPAAADHAAEAIAAIKRSDLAPELVNLLKEPDPSLPVKAENGYSVKEVVRINHLCNCVLCHAPSVEGNDRIRVSVVQPSEKPSTFPYSTGGSGASVRADLTHLRQDFSVVQPVPIPGKWPGEQRFDYLVRTRALTAMEQTAFEKAQKENKILKTYPQQGSVLFALRELTGKDYGNAYEDWATRLPIPENQPRSKNARSQER